MATTNNQHSVLWRLRALTPRRSLLKHEAMSIAELQANRLLALLGIDEPGVPTEAVANLAFLRVVLRSDLPVSGSAQWIKPRWLVLLNDAEPNVRRRFSLMHEFKHILDHETANYHSFGPTEGEAAQRTELVADYFAACVLMPKRLVKRLWGEGVQHPRELAAAFGVSLPAMRYRLHQLGLSEPYARCVPRRTSSPHRIYWRERDHHLVPLSGAAA